MTSLLDALSGRARVLAASLILITFGLIILLPVGFGVSALVSAMQNHASAREANAQIELRLRRFEGRRAELASRAGITQPAIEAYLDGVATHSEFSARVVVLAEALRARGVAVSGETRVLERRQPNGVMLLSTDLSMTGGLSEILAVLSLAEFADLRTQGGSFAAQGAPGEVRGALRLVQRHVGASIEEANGDEA